MTDRGIQFRGHSLVELVVALALAAVSLAALYIVRFSPPDDEAISTSSTAGAGAGGRYIQGQMHKLMRELQEGTRLFYPLPGKGIHAGLGFVNARGETILLYLQPVPGSELSTLYRVNAQVDRRSTAPLPPFVENVSHFRVSVAPAEPGKEASLAHVDLAVEVSGHGSEKPRRVNFVDAAFLRNLERYVPDDLFPAGTPLVNVDGN